jgi:hypothetical protein
MTAGGTQNAPESQNGSMFAQYNMLGKKDAATASHVNFRTFDKALFGL